MKKIVLGLVLVFGLSACSSTPEKSLDSSSKTSSTEITSTSETVVSNSDSSEAPAVNEENLNAVAKVLDEKFNTDGETLVKVEIENDVIDDTSDVAHSVITATVTDSEARKNMETMQDAVNSNTADDTQRTSIYGIQVNVEEVAKQLENENDVVKFVNPDSNGNSIVIAMSKKNENIIPLLIVE